MRVWATWAGPRSGETIWTHAAWAMAAIVCWIGVVWPTVME
jgi:hypothetical protein